MAQSEIQPSFGALEKVRRLAGSLAAIRTVTRLEGGQHSDTWRVDTEDPAHSVVIRQFPVADHAAAGEQRVLQTLDGLGGLAPVLLGGDLTAQWSEHPTSLISWLDGQADITPTDPERWADELGRAIAVVHAVPSGRLMTLPSVFDRSGGSQGVLDGPLATEVRSRWAQVTASPEVLTHSDYWSGNVVWRDGKLTGIVDWSGGARGPRGFDLGWCRLDLLLLFDEQVADVFLWAYETAIGSTVCDMALWDSWAVARSHDLVETWVPNYAPLGRADLDESELRRRHSQWTAQLLERTGPADP
ncbi:MAG: phosphotransferase family protein [Solirubrobacteraceae bacterium]